MIFVASDLHVGRVMRKGIPELAGDSFEALKHLCNQIITFPTEEKKSLILAGDIYDMTRIDGSTTKAVGDFCNTLVNDGVMIYFVEGNHDKQDHNNTHAYPLLLANASEESRGKIYHLSKYSNVTIDGRVVKGFDYLPPEKLKENIKNVEADILVLHQAFEELLPFEGRFDISFEDIPHSIKHVVSGDIHTSCLKEMTPERWFLSPGSLHPCALDQCTPRGFWTMGSTEKTWTFHVIPTRQAFNLELDADVTIDSEFLKLVNVIKEDAKGAVQKPLLAVWYTREKGHVVEYLHKELDNSFILVEFPSSTGKIMSGESLPDTVKKFERLTMEQALPFVCNVDLDRDVYLLLEEMLNGTDAGMAVDKFVIERIN